jgi:hypothetical protein
MIAYILIDHDGVHSASESAPEDQIINTLDVRMVDGDTVRFQSNEGGGELKFWVHPSGALFVQATARGPVRVFGPAAWSSVDGEHAASEEKTPAWT